MNQHVRIIVYCTVISYCYIHFSIFLYPYASIRLNTFNCKSFAGNEDLEKAVRLFEGELMGPEGFAVDGDGT